MPNAQAGRPDVKRSPRRRTRVKGTPRRRAVQAVTYRWLLLAAGDCRPPPPGRRAYLNLVKGSPRRRRPQSFPRKPPQEPPRKFPQTAALRPQAVSTASKHTGFARVGGCAAGPAAAKPSQFVPSNHTQLQPQISRPHPSFVNFSLKIVVF